MSRGITLERVVEFFRTSNLDVADITLTYVSEIMLRRREQQEESAAAQGAAAGAGRAPRKTRKRKGTLGMAVAGAGERVLTPTEHNSHDCIHQGYQGE